MEVWLHYIAPGSLKIRSIKHRLKPDDLRKIIEENESWLLKTSRRWLQKSEMPYPGYCRAPGSGKCSPVLCNCEKLTEIWKKLKKNNLTYHKKILM
ncbi:jg18108 [Pararge aegeria aegeria]|uniref:Jg18108 protein n=1 Tax=Pararge aegeria aegeria TaxID=348720 RepID=A0A8S4RM60_9NEOP|nr:jg18108 [Pararge aegeria aegeria]